MEYQLTVIAAATIAAGVVRIDSSKHQDPAEVAKLSLAIVAEIEKQAPAEAIDEPATEGKPGKKVRASAD